MASLSVTHKESQPDGRMCSYTWSATYDRVDAESLRKLVRREGLKLGSHDEPSQLVEADLGACDREKASAIHEKLHVLAVAMDRQAASLAG